MWKGQFNEYCECCRTCWEQQKIVFHCARHKSKVTIARTNLNEMFEVRLPERRVLDECKHKDKPGHSTKYPNCMFAHSDAELAFWKNWRNCVQIQEDIPNEECLVFLEKSNLIFTHKKHIASDASYDTVFMQSKKPKLAQLQDWALDPKGYESQIEQVYKILRPQLPRVHFAFSLNDN